MSKDTWPDSQGGKEVRTELKTERKRKGQMESKGRSQHRRRGLEVMREG